MPKSVALAEYSDIFVLGFCEPLDEDALLELPNPYLRRIGSSGYPDDQSGAEEGKWPKAAILQADGAGASVIGVFTPRLVSASIDGNPRWRVNKQKLMRKDYARNVMGEYLLKLAEIGYHELPGRYEVVEDPAGIHLQPAIRNLSF